jgi:hypothetical protein
MDTQALKRALPGIVERRGRTYVLTGTLGAIFFTLSGIFWNRTPFLGSLFLELGGGAFIVFLLEFVLPAALGATESVLKFRTRIVWASSALGDLLTKVDELQLDETLAAVRNDRRPFPSRASRKRRITKIKGSDLKAWIIPDPEIVLVYRLKRRSWRRREAIIVSVMRTEEIADEAAKEALLRRYS